MHCGSVLFAGLIWLAGLTPAAGQSLINLDPNPAPAVAPPRQLTVFVSRSLPDSELRALFIAAAGRRDVRIVFRGIRPGERLNDAIHDLHALLRGIESPPAVELDPPAFRAAGVTAVPVLLLQERGQTVARVQGTLALDWFEREVAAGRHGDLGTYGPVRDIVEPDLIEELQRRVATLDWNRLRNQAAARYWQRATFVELPPATANRRYSVDLSVTVGNDITAPDGRFVARAGDRLDPLQFLPFTQRLIVFDATRPEQVAMARRLAADNGGKRTVLLATRLDRTAGWESLDTLEQTLAAPVYLLNAAVRDRFRLERAPAVVEAVDGRLWVREIKP